MPTTLTKALYNAIRVLIQVEDLGPSATGVLYIGQQHRCAILLDRGRVCWAATGSTQNQLSRLILDEGSSGFDRQALQCLYRRCRKNGAPLLQTLLDEGAVSHKGLRRSLLRHTCQSLTTACQDPRLWVRWQAEPDGSYASHFTFPTHELLAELLPMVQGSSAIRARALLDHLVPTGGSGVAFAAGHQPLPIAFIDGGSPKVGELHTTTDWAYKLVDTAQRLDPNATDLIVRSRRERDAKVVIGFEQGFVLVVHCPTQSDLGLVVAKRSRARQAALPPVPELPPPPPPSSALLQPAPTAAGAQAGAFTF